MWWKPYLPAFFDIIIKAFVLKDIVNPNKVFISGYSAGGDGIYHLAPMMADWLAGAAMMAGHPNGVEIYNVRNISFSVQVGGQDEAYDRNQMGMRYINRMN
jgi:poly(3-hydroxybutyrate) depolymerase